MYFPGQIFCYDILLVASNDAWLDKDEWTCYGFPLSDICFVKASRGSDGPFRFFRIFGVQDCLPGAENIFFGRGGGIGRG